MFCLALLQVSQPTFPIVVWHRPVSHSSWAQEALSVSPGAPEDPGHRIHLDPLLSVRGSEAGTPEQREDSVSPSLDERPLHKAVPSPAWPQAQELQPAWAGQEG